MNYIKKLEHEVEVGQAYAQALCDGMQDLLVYLDSPKFDDDPTVQKRDVINFIRQARANAVLAAANVGVTPHDE